MRILLVEDNRQLASWLARLLRSGRYVVDTVHDGARAITAISTMPYDLVILDLGLPDMTGLEVLRRLREQGIPIPVIILTASDAVSQRVAGLDAGADDYLVKPFDPQELEARIRALLRRRAIGPTVDIIYGPLTLDTAGKQITLNGSVLDLTGREYGVLESLLLAAGRVVSKASLAESVFGFDDDATDNAIDICVHRVRKKLAEGPVSIGTLRGLGYALRLSNG